MDKVFVRLPLENVSNCRDLGGYGAQSGRVTKWQRFLRSSNLSLATEEGLQFLRDYGLVAAIDLRTADEVDRKVNPFRGDDQVDYYHVNLLGTADLGDNLMQNQDKNLLGQVYIQLLEKHDLVKQIFDIIQDHPDGAILYHCSAGKDRTGVVSMLILGLAGVADQDIITNYEVSFTNIIHSYSPEEVESMSLNMMRSTPDNIQVAIQHLRDKYSSFHDYFKTLGYSEAEIADFIESWTEPIN